MKTTNTIATLQKRNTPFTWVILFIACWFFVPSLIMDKIWMNVKSVHVQEETPFGEVIIMKVEREILRDFQGTFSVSVRRQDGELICQGRPDESFQYRTEGILPEPVTLSYWLGGPEKLMRCRGNGFGEGTYYIDTCHTVVIGSGQVPFARRCVRSNLFTIIPERDEDDA